MSLPKPDPAVLRAAPMAELLHRPMSDLANWLTEALVELTLEAEATSPDTRKRKRSGVAMDNLQSTIAALTRDLLQAASSSASEGWCFRPEGNPYFTDTEATAPQYRAVWKAWERIRLMERLPGIRHGREFDGVYVGGSGKAVGRAPRLRATPKLLALAADHGITPENLGNHFERFHDTTYPVILRRKLAAPGRRGSKVSENVRFPRTEETDRIAEEVRALNAFFGAQTYEPSMVPRFVAIFGEDPSRPGELTWGGRLSASGEHHFQNWHKPVRRSLRINGEQVVELDLRASHLSIFLARQGIHLPEGADPYEVPALPRFMVKRLVNVLLSNGHLRLKRWPQGMAEDYRAETEGRTLSRDYRLRDTVKRIVQAIPALAQLPDSGLAWGELQRIEAGILRATLTRLREAGIPALPVHDSITVPEQHMDAAARMLSKEFQKATQATPGLSVNRFGQDPVPWTDPKEGQGST